jgi:hypothetical protein
MHVELKYAQIRSPFHLRIAHYNLVCGALYSEILAHYKLVVQYIVKYAGLPAYLCVFWKSYFDAVTRCFDSARRDCVH